MQVVLGCPHESLIQRPRPSRGCRARRPGCHHLRRRAPRVCFRARCETVGAILTEWRIEQNPHAHTLDRMSPVGCRARSARTPYSRVLIWALHGRERDRRGSKVDVLRATYGGLYSYPVRQRDGCRSLMDASFDLASREASKRAHMSWYMHGIPYGV